MKNVLLVATLSLNQSAQTSPGPMQRRAQCPAQRASGAPALDDVLLETSPDIIAPLGMQLHADRVQGPIDHSPGPVTIQLTVWGRTEVGHVDVLPIFIAQRETHRTTTTAKACSVLPAFDQMGAQPRKQKRRLLSMIDDGRGALVLALQHQFGKQLLHGIFSIVRLTAPGTVRRRKANASDGSRAPRHRPGRMNRWCDWRRGLLRGAWGRRVVVMPGLEQPRMTPGCGPALIAIYLRARRSTPRETCRVLLLT
jgi:hypothetical protein